jgi:hypothetical protein
VDKNFALQFKNCRRGAEHLITQDLYISNHESIFWFGDLNYRMDENISSEEVFNRIEALDYQFLCAYDQLLIEKKKGQFIRSNQSTVTHKRLLLITVRISNTISMMMK